jgi:hypothetical protein
MKRFLSLLLFSSYVYAQDVDTSTALESLVFKAGITALISDFEREKNITKQHSVDIEELKQNVKFLMEQSLKSKFGADSDVANVPNVIMDDESQIKLDLLKKENKKLREYIESLKVQKQQITTYKKQEVTYEINSAKVIAQTSAIYTEPNSDSNILRYQKFGDIIVVSGCNKYGWCQLKDKEEYIPKYRIKFLK